MDNNTIWIVFNLFVILMLALDLGVFHPKSKKVSIKDALTWTCIWILLALAFNAGVYHYLGQEAAIEFLTGYLLEKSLGVDNLFVFILLFSFFKVPEEYQHRVLFWGVFGALILRAIFIAIGVVLIERFDWIIYVFGVFLIITGYKMFTKSFQELHPEDNPVVRWFVKKGRVTDEYHGRHFFVKMDDKWLATPLFLCLLSIEFTDIIFAVDSIPAIFAVTNDPFIVYTSNVFAILGLRSLYFALENIINRFQYLRYGLAIVLVFIGLKMLASSFIKIPVVLSLVIILTILITSIAWKKFDKKSKILHDEN